jgi:large subunit ribosomal protein L6
MSRIGKKPIAIPEKTSVSVVESRAVVKGPLGELSRAIPSGVKVDVKDNVVTVTAPNPLKSALWGTMTAHIKNMIAGVNKVYEKKLIVEGIGFKADIKGKDLVMALGFSHPVVVPIPDGLKVVSEKNIITVSGIDKELVGNFTASTRAYKKPEPYKGKGIRYDGEVIRRKQGKKAA